MSFIMRLFAVGGAVFLRTTWLTPLLFMLSEKGGVLVLGSWGVGVYTSNCNVYKEG